MATVVVTPAGSVGKKVEKANLEYFTCDGAQSPAQCSGFNSQQLRLNPCHRTLKVFIPENRPVFVISTLHRS